MTCIVGVEYENGVIIGGDSAGVDGGGTVVLRSDEKVFQVEQVVIGYTTSFRMGQILRYNLRVPCDDPEMDDTGWMVRRFIPAVMEALTECKWKKSDSERASGGHFLVAHRGRLYVVCEDFQVGRPSGGYCAEGSGMTYALGSLHTSRGGQPMDRVRVALEAAAEHNAYVRPPWRFIKQERTITQEVATAYTATEVRP